jgi:CheY-like chemotaxis protein
VLTTGIDGARAPRTRPGRPGVWERSHWVLVVDDERPIRELLVAALCGEPGLMAWGARDGRVALEMCDAMIPDAVLTDLRMPRMDGFELAARLRATPALGETVLVGMSAMGAPQLERALAAGCEEVIAKPFDLDELIATLRRRLL